MGDGFKRRMSAIASRHLPPSNSAHRPILLTYSGYPPPAPPGYPPPAPPTYPPMCPALYLPPVSPPTYIQAYPPVPNYPYPPPISYPQLPNPAYPPPAENLANSQGGNQANPPAAGQPDNEANPGSRSTENQIPAPASCSQLGYPTVNQFVLVSQLVVIGPQFCFPYPVDLTIARKIMTVSEGNFGVTDSQGNVMFTVRGKLFSPRDRRLLLDAYGNPLVSLQQKIITAHRRWQIFKGDSADHKDLLFSVRKSSIMQFFGTGLDVFLAHNTTEHNCDYKVKGSYFEKSCTIYSRANTVIAQMHKKHTIESILLGKESFEVTIYPNVDHAFIVALVIVLEEINADKNGKD